MVLRLLLEGAISTPFAKIFGGKFSTSDPSKSAKAKCLFDKNLKFGSMPTQPLGASTVFHAGIIGAGKRSVPLEDQLADNEIQTNIFLCVSVLFKLCHCPVKSGDAIFRQTEIDRREQSKEACKQLALLVVELVSPVVMYNGLPWPDEEFSRVTIERDLKICSTLTDHPILWKILWGLAESRPSLCYCSVLLRAALAVQVFSN